MDQLSRRDLLKRALTGGLGLAALSTLQLTAMSKALAAQSAGITGSSPASAYAGLPAVAYWQNIFPAAAGGGTCRIWSSMTLRDLVTDELVNRESPQ